MDDNVTLTLTSSEVEAILTFLGNLPINTNAFYLYDKIKGQVNEQSNSKPV